MNQDLEHLRLLSIFHYIVAAITALLSSFPLIHVTIGLRNSAWRVYDHCPDQTASETTLWPQQRSRTGNTMTTVGRR